MRQIGRRRGAREAAQVLRGDVGQLAQHRQHGRHHLGQCPQPFGFVVARRMARADVCDVFVDGVLQRGLDDALRLVAQLGLQRMAPGSSTGFGVEYGRLRGVANQAHSALVAATALDDGGHVWDSLGTVPPF